MIEIIGDDNLEKFLKSSKEKIKKLSEYFQTIHQADHKTQVTIKIVSNDEIKSMNKNFRKKNKITDVLSFPDGDFAGDIAIADSYISVSYTHLTLPTIYSV